MAAFERLSEGPPVRVSIVKFLKTEMTFQWKFFTVQTFGALSQIQGVFFTGPPPKKLKYGKPRLSEVRCIYDVLDTPNLA